MGKIKEFVDSNADGGNYGGFDAPEDYHAAMAEMAYWRTIDDFVNLMMTYGKPGVIRDMEARYYVSMKHAFGEH